MSTSAWRTCAVVAMIAAVVSGLGNAVLLVVLLHKSRPPFLLTVTPEAGDAIVQFIQPVGFDDKMVVSPKFRVSASIIKPFQVALTSDRVRFPGAKVEFSDTTLLPGRFKIRIGDSQFDVMSSRINVDGKDYDWLEAVSKPREQTGR